jgi:anti-sigma regulatory factor (Ser/Thr protein kinase)
VDLVLVLSALPAAQRDARHALQDWLRALRWPDEAADDVLLAVTEAVANVIDHAYPPARPGLVHMHAWVWADAAGERRVTVSVIDRGRWRPPSPSRAEAGHRGRGLAMMGALTARLHLQPSDAGTTVIMVSHPVAVN